MSNIILVSGKNRSGKDTLSNYLVNNYNFIKIDIGSDLKSMFSLAYRITLDELELHKDFFRYNWKISNLKQIDYNLYQKILSSSLDDFDEETENLGLVELSSQMKKYYGDDYWIKIACDKNKEILSNPNTNVVFCNFRVPLELVFIRTNTKPKKVDTIRIDCEGKNIIQRGGTLKKHILETGLDNYNFNFRINNNSTFDDFYNGIDNIMTQLSISKVKK